MPTTITISKETKDVLKSLKKDKNWDVFLREMAEECMRVRRERVRRELRKLLVEETRVRRWAREY